MASSVLWQEVDPHVWSLIAEFVPLRDLLRIRRVSKRMAAVVESPAVLFRLAGPLLSVRHYFDDPLPERPNRSNSIWSHDESQIYPRHQGLYDCDTTILDTWRQEWHCGYNREDWIELHGEIISERPDLYVFKPALKLLNCGVAVPGNIRFAVGKQKLNLNDNDDAVGQPASPILINNPHHDANDSHNSGQEGAETAPPAPVVSAVPAVSVVAAVPAVSTDDPISSSADVVVGLSGSVRQQGEESDGGVVPTDARGARGSTAADDAEPVDAASRGEVVVDALGFLEALVWVRGFYDLFQEAKIVNEGSDGYTFPWTPILVYVPVIQADGTVEGREYPPLRRTASRKTEADESIRLDAAGGCDDNGDGSKDPRNPAGSGNYDENKVAALRELLKAMNGHPALVAYDHWGEPDCCFTSPGKDFWSPEFLDQVISHGHSPELCGVENTFGMGGATTNYCRIQRRVVEMLLEGGTPAMACLGGLECLNPCPTFLVKVLGRGWVGGCLSGGVYT